MPALRLDNLGFAYGNDWLFKNVNIQIDAGEFVGIIGPNGAGKSTLLRLLADIYKPTQGQVYLFDCPLAKFTDWQAVGYVPQNPARQQKAFPITVREVVSLGILAGRGIFSGLTSADKQVIAEIMQEFNLTELAERKLGDLSGGQQQKVFLAKAMVNKPKLLLLDEPATGIDTKTKIELYEYLHDLNRRAGCTIVMISHDLELTAKMAGRALCIDRGVCFFGEAKTVLAHHSNKHGYFYEGRDI